jgi:hypothetical protein
VISVAGSVVLATVTFWAFAPTRVTDVDERLKAVVWAYAAAGISSAKASERAILLIESLAASIKSILGQFESYNTGLHNRALYGLQAVTHSTDAGISILHLF